eukprot:TRINITY_DN44027_c0_g1_i1.p1 TRINITY_DN44027_c0_g1~~TRINITY_DN44027_c0_g1_i1.p1  ORF type:complete len:480 (+),score=235.06 TRINITY_DN44027_c0_g1_i1:67-1506(+)
MQRVRTLAKHGPAAELAKGKQPPSFAVISETELENLGRFLTYDPTAAAKADQAHRLELQRISKERERNWPNTIEALRLKKERDRQQRLEEQEQQRCKVDDAEATFQATVREGAIRKANLMLYEQDDRVKNFSSKMFLSHVLDERAKQVLLQRQKEELQRQQEYKWAILQDEAVRRAKEEEDAKVALQRERAKELRTAQRMQLEQVRARKLRERDETREEGRRVREAAERAILKEKESDDARRARAVEINRQYLLENRRQQELHAQKVKDEEEEFKKIQHFAELKEEQMLERKRRAEEKFMSKLDARQRMIDRQAAHLEALKDEEEERVLTQMRDAEKERQAKEAREKDRRERRWREIDESRRQQLRRIQGQKELARAERQRTSDRLRKMEDQLMDEELKEREDTRGRARRLQQFQKLQIREREMRTEKDKREEQSEGHMMVSSMAEEDDMFQSYVKSVMGDFRTRADARKATESKAKTL